jgi:UDP-N-acetylglucosamine 2-epimerase
MQAVLQAAASLPMRKVVVFPCSDPGYEGVIRAIDEVEAREDFLVYKNIDNLDFLGLMAEARLMLGNSSSALVEAPYFQLAAVNVGERQRGRDRDANVVDCASSVEAITQATDTALNDHTFRSKLPGCGGRLGDGTASDRIVDVLKSIELSAALFRKRLA